MITRNLRLVNRDTRVVRSRLRLTGFVGAVA
jgi:hypothetical protein